MRLRLRRSLVFYKLPMYYMGLAYAGKYVYDTYNLTWLGWKLTLQVKGMHE